MRAIILAAGQGTRLLPFTRQHPKCLVPVGGKAILDHQLEALADNDITEVLIMGGYRIDRLEQHLWQKPAAQRPGLLLNPFYAVTNSIGSVWAARHQLHEPFCLLNGDTLFSAGLIAAALDHATGGVNLLVEATEDFMLDDMLVAVEGDRVRAVGKTLAEGTATHRSMGFIIAKGAGPYLYVEALDEVIGAEGGHGRFHHAIIDRLAWDGAVRAIEGDGSSALEIDRPEDIERWQAEG